MASFSLLNTNVLLTGNIKLVVDSIGSLYLESIDSDPILSNDLYKKYRISGDSKYSDIIHNFWRGLDRNYVYKVFNKDDVSDSYIDFGEQFDDLYLSGSRYIQNKSYVENFEIFAPLYIDKLNIPKYFMIFRIDGSGVRDLNVDNFNTEYVRNLKCVKVFNLKNMSNIGKWLNNNYVDNPLYNGLSMNFDFRKDEFIKWYGIDYINGGYLEMSLLNSDIVNHEYLYKDLNDIITNGYKKNNLIYSNILNLSFLFDDLVGIDKWKLNQYSGYYMNDLEKYKSFTLYNSNVLKNDQLYKIDNNNYIYVDNNGVFDYNIEPFDYGYKKNDEMYNYIYIELEGIFYKVERIKYIVDQNGQTYINNNNLIIEDNGIVYGYKYKIISSNILSNHILSDFNRNKIMINTTTKEIYYTDQTPILTNLEYDTSDVWVIDIDGVYHNIVGRYDSDVFKTFINTDYNFLFDTEKVLYYVGSNIQNMSKVNINIGVDNLPKSCNLYKCVFTDVKYLDTDIIDTVHSKYEYEYYDKLSDTDETKMYMSNLNSNSIPKDIDDYIYEDDVVNIPVSSEYIASNELFSISNNNLNNLWSKNSLNIKWGFDNSISSSDYPYMLNINIHSEDYNRTCSLDNYYPDIMERNLDYFYTILKDVSIMDCDFQTLNINTQFSIKEYIESIDYDYFKSIFRSSMLYNNNKRNFEKFSKFIYSDGSITNSTIFRGIKFNIHRVDNIKLSNGNIDKISYNSTNNFNDYDFSILLSENDHSVFRSNVDGFLGITQSSVGSFQWKTIDMLGNKKLINNGDYIISNNIVYEYVGTNIINIDDFIDIMISPDNNFLMTLNDSVFWNPNNVYVYDDYIYYNGEYYNRKNNTSIVDFWNPYKLDYILDEVVYHNGNFYKYVGITPITYDISILIPDVSSVWIIDDTVSMIDFRWNVVDIWSPSIVYDVGDFVYQNGMLCKSLISNNSNIVSDLESWSVVYNIQHDTNIIYNSGVHNNSIFLFNNTYYLCMDNINNKTLDNGIVVYINNIHKNILINIYINDNTYSDILYNKRTDLYDNKIYSKLTSTNFINILNNISDSGGFSDLVKYVIIDKDDINIYDANNINELSYILSCDVIPDLLKVKNNSILSDPINITSNILKSNTKLDSGNIRNMSMLNWYDDSLPIATSVSYVKFYNENDINFHGMSKNSYVCLYRYSGYYTPIFKSINLFNYDDLKNYRFDTTLEDFGIMKRVLSSKVSRDGDILRLSNNVDYKSIYPMMNEFGYMFIDRFIFKSNWDLKYYTEIKR